MVDGGVTEHIWPDTFHVPVRQSLCDKFAMEYPDTLLRTECLKILHRTKVNVGRVVPLEGELSGDRHAAP